jgi:heat shock protein HslJ
MKTLHLSFCRTSSRVWSFILAGVFLLGLSLVHIPFLRGQAAVDPVLSLDSLRNAEYLSLHTTSGGAFLADGSYRERILPGTASEIVVNLTRSIAYGQLDQRDAAAVILITQTGGTGVFYDLAVMVNQNGKAVNLAVTSLGDRVRIESLAIVDGEIVVGMVTQGPGDPMCCPTRNVVERYSLVGTVLIRKPPTPPDQADALSPLTGETWRWREFRLNDGRTVRIDDPDQYTLRFVSDSGFILRADCNRGGGTYTREENRLDLRVTRVTRMACPPGSLTDDYLLRLKEVYGFRREGDFLYLLLRTDAGAMAFSRE